MKQILIHVGPHKTGSTSLQSSLVGCSSDLKRLGIGVLHDSETHDLSLCLARENYEQADAILKSMLLRIASMEEDTIIISREDFSGDLPGRTSQKRIYPKLTKNLRVLERGLRPYDVSFAFFRRNEQDWLRSCYVQHLKYRTKFSSFDQFIEWVEPDLNWSTKLEKPKDVFGETLNLIDYTHSPSAGLSDLLKIAGLTKAQIKPFLASDRLNASPSIADIGKLEHINKVSEFPETAWFAKNLVLSNWAPNLVHSEKNGPHWPPKGPKHSPVAFPELAARVDKRFHKYDVTDALPKLDVSLRHLAFDLLPAETSHPRTKRHEMEEQVKILNHHLRGKSRLTHLNALCISYLRRDTKHTNKARKLFHRIWEEEGLLLVNELPTRWLISTLQTFLDHGKSEAQRQIGTAGYFYANLMKVYEGERAIEGLGQSAQTKHNKPQTKTEFRGLDRFDLGGTDLMLNTNALLLEIAQKDDVAGLVLQEFLLRVRASHNVFTRLDAARAEQQITVDGLDNTWSFFEPKM